MKSMNKTMRKTIAVFLALLAFALSVYGAIVWTWMTKVTILEPFTVESDLPDELISSPGEILGPYIIKVTNNGRIDYTATLSYSTTASPGVKFTITPPSGKSELVKPGGTVSFEIYIEVHKDSAIGTLNIDWQIERS
ncbi:MAG: hypothetical protein RMJ14_06340 [Nitrososphaerota archaeon]|nr:hypothetical protein [Nitrososphaerota archaeon]